MLEFYIILIYEVSLWDFDCDYVLWSFNLLGLTEFYMIEVLSVSKLLRSVGINLVLKTS